MADAAVEVKSYYLPPTALIPNSPKPLLHYPGLFSQGPRGCSPVEVYDRFSSNGWETQWLIRYGATQESHYHSAAHECMVVLSGEATIRFGVADTVADLQESTYGSGREEGGVELRARVGDVFILPAGTAHKTFGTSPAASFRYLSPGDGHRIDAEDARKALAEIDLSGFTMIGAYPANSVWNFAKGGEDAGNYERVWSVPKPESDPVLGQAATGLCDLWQ